ncbi:organic hydroperoxide resistance protein [Sinorhizobium sp. RAC02]|uniref:organic hydroperoxide resistance protein n=1 Tax=Sinorhizobium sp. RAC02 TaxID=1842534 RepID=UPI00083D730A|nr:organic hydroperoxide resistance protein [Sinorhizobium sp. RAC02]AOF88440.1 peroxiredoxin, Ohr subfamily protein [Sinorhizobium sp. RAC02]
MPILYRTKASSTGGRAGHGATEDGTVDVTLTVPKELGGDGATGANPEKLFAVGYSACFLGALKFVAGKEKVKIPDDAKVTATVGIGPREDGGGFGLEASLEISVPGVDKAVVEDLAKKAHVVCPYSNATRGNLDVKTTVV